MNLVLLEGSEAAGGPVRLEGRRAAHVLGVLGASPGGRIRVGALGGRVGFATVLAAGGGAVTLSAPTLDREAPAPWFDLLLAMPRPKVLRRLWASLASLGVRRIAVVGAAKVERFYFDSHWLSPATYVPLLKEGLEQAGTTFLPEVDVRRAFRPFVEDELPALFPDAPKFVAHPRPPGEPAPAPAFPQDPPPGAPLPLVAVGPEGGWNDFELDLLARAGFRPLALGRRPLRTDVACAALAGALAGARAYDSNP